jgi:Mor family transcriptional regulator
MKTPFNDKLKADARKRRARLYAEHILGKSCMQLAKKHGISRQRIQVLLDMAKADLNIG